MADDYHAHWNWTPDAIANANRQLHEWQADEANELAAADVLRSHADDHSDTAWRLRTRQENLRKRMKDDGVWDEGEAEPGA